MVLGCCDENSVFEEEQAKRTGIPPTCNAQRSDLCIASCCCCQYATCINDCKEAYDYNANQDENQRACLCFECKKGLPCIWGEGINTFCFNYLRCCNCKGYRCSYGHVSPTNLFCFFTTGRHSSFQTKSFCGAAFFLWLLGFALFFGIEAGLWLALFAVVVGVAAILLFACIIVAIFYVAFAAMGGGNTNVVHRV